MGLDFRARGDFFFFGGLEFWRASDAAGKHEIYAIGL